MKYLVYTCENCGKQSERRMSSVYAVLKKTGRVPRFCSVACISESLRLGKGKSAQLTGLQKLKATKTVKEYFITTHTQSILDFCIDRQQTKNFVNLDELAPIIQEKEPEFSENTIKRYIAEILKTHGAEKLNHHSGALNIQNLKKE